VIRSARLSDLAALDSLSRHASKTAYGFYPDHIQRQIARRNSWRPLLTGMLLRRRTVLVCFEDGRPVGLLIGTPDNDGVGVIQWLYVHPDVRGRGSARQLIDEFERRLPLSVHKMMVWTEIAADYYRKLGWDEAVKLDNFWWGEDFTILTKPVKRLS
jgi:ribosomal protein S18 acetylase RimI-like enzyme